MLQKQLIGSSLFGCALLADIPVHWRRHYERHCGCRQNPAWQCLASIDPAYCWYGQPLQRSPKSRQRILELIQLRPAGRAVEDMQIYFLSALSSEPIAEFLRSQM